MDVGQRLKHLRNHRCFWRDRGMGARIIRHGGVEGRANNGGRRNSCREGHRGRVTARRGDGNAGSDGLRLGEEQVWKQWKKIQYSPKMGCVSSDSPWNQGWGGYKVWAHPVAWDVAGQDGLRREGTKGISHCFPNIRDDWYIEQDIMCCCLFLESQTEISTLCPPSLLLIL